MTYDPRVSNELASSQDAAVAEIKSFLAGLEHRSPQEAIGMNDESGLWKGLVLGSIMIAILTAVGTVVPYLLEQREGSTQASVKPVAEPQANNATEQPAAAAGDDAGLADGTPAAATGEGNPPNPDKVLDSLGIGEAKSASPKENPRESELENLLDGIK